MMTDNDKNNSTFAARLCAARIAAGVTQTWLAERLGVTRATVSRWESGDREPQRLDQVRACAQALDVPMTELLGVCEYG